MDMGHDTLFYKLMICTVMRKRAIDGMDGRYGCLRMVVDGLTPGRGSS